MYNCSRWVFARKGVNKIPQIQRSNDGRGLHAYRSQKYSPEIAWVAQRRGAIRFKDWPYADVFFMLLWRHLDNLTRKREVGQTNVLKRKARLQGRRTTRRNIGRGRRGARWGR